VPAINVRGCVSEEFLIDVLAYFNRSLRNINPKIDLLDIFPKSEAGSILD